MKLLIKNYIKKNKSLFRHYLNIRNYFSTKKKLKESTGQVKSKELEFKIWEIIKSCKVENIVEIGTWNGLGSTKMIINLIKKSNKRISFYSIESDILCLKSAKKNLKDDSKFVKFILGRVYELDELNYVNKEVIYEYGYGDREFEWFIQDIRRYKKIKNVKYRLPDSIDILFLDGGEFSGYADFLNLYKRSKFIILDDTTSFKQHHVIEFIKMNVDLFELIFNLDDRGGVQIYRVNQ